MSTNYIFIDFENVQPDSLSLLDADHFKVKVFVGAHQNKLAFGTASALQKLGERAEYVKIKGSGTNALDFHIAFYIGRISAQDPAASFHIISKDTGFEPLLQHLRDQNILAARFKDVLDIPDLKAANGKTTPERLNLVIASLQQRGASKLPTLKALTNTVNAIFHKQVSVEELEAIVKTLETDGLITVNKNKVSYDLPVCKGQ